MSGYQKIIDLRNMYLIKQSGYFDDKYYKVEYPEVHGNRLKHYYYEGWKKGYNPSNKFDNDYYLLHNTDVANADINPLLHYIISGKREGRRILDVKGMKLSTVYSIFEHKKYSYFSFLENSFNRRLTIFYDDQKYFDALITIIEKFSKSTSIRILYNDFDFDRFYHFVNENHIDMSRIELLKWNSRYYLNVGVDEKFICFDYSILISLLNTSYITFPIYYYVDECSPNDSHQNMWLSYYVDKKRVVLCGDKDVDFNKYKLVVHNEIERIHKDIIKIGFQFDKISVAMLNIYQEYFLYQTNLEHYSFMFNSSNFCKNICFNNNKTIKYQSSLEDVDVLIKFGYDENYSSHHDNVIQVYFEKEDGKLRILSLDKLSFEEGDDDV